MKKQIILLAALAAIMGMSSCGTQTSTGKQNLTMFVDQRIGTGGNGHVFMGANVPSGLVQVGPSQYTRGWDWCSGYHDSDSVLIGFGTMHLSGTGIGCLGDIALLPVTNADQHDVIFSHDDENMEPGYYSVHLWKPNVTVELTATQRVAMYKFTTIPRGDVDLPDTLLLRLDLAQCIGWDKMTECHYTQESPTLITGYRRSTGWAADRYTFFSMAFSEPVDVLEGSNDTLALIRPQTQEGNDQLIVKTALSPVSIEGAKANMLAEADHWDFDRVVSEADEAWNRELSRITIKTNDDEVRTIFYTAMYHLLTAPSVFCDVNGDYRGADGKVYHGDFTNYTTLSLWDTYRAAHPLMTLIMPDKQRDFAETFLNICQQQGDLPVWHLMGNETDCMVGNPGMAVLADLTLKGFVDNPQQALDAMKQTALRDDRSLGLLKQYGYIPYDLEPTNETVAKALEYCLAEDGAARVAKKLGADDDYRFFYERSRSYSKYFDPATGFMRAVDSKGQFREPFDPIRVIHRADDYTEGNAWQYTWLVPHDVHGLINLFGGNDAFLAKFDSLFTTEGDMGEEASPDISGFIGQYAHGNEPSHHIIYMYNYAGQPWKAAPLLRKVMNEMYTTRADGLIGNEDVGQMSAWYILSSVGLYQVEPAGGRFIIGSPVVDEAVLNVGNNRTFTIQAKDNSRENIYVQSATLNGKPYTKSYIDYADIMAGGTLQLQMGPKPSDWGTAEEDIP